MIVNELPLQDSSQPSTTQPWWKRSVAWMKNHKAKTLVIVAALILGVEIGTIPFFSVARLKSENPSETALMRQRIREAEGEGKKMNIVHTWISISRIPQHVINAVVVAEDGTFFSHGGIDWFEVQESVEKNISEGRAARGASTITQQVAKNLYLSTSKDPIRKLKEVIITLLLEQQLSKNRILEVYLNVIEWGRGIFGVESAARAYFGKSASSLSLEEATRLAAVIPSPLRHRPDANSRYVLRRKNIVLRRMLARNFTEQITTQENESNSILEPHRRVDTAAIAPENTIPEDSTDTEGEEYNGL